MSFGTLIIVKTIVAIGVVLILSMIAETVGSKWVGVVSGLPTGSAIMLYFYAFENGLLFASESALYNIIGLVAMQAFIFGYYCSDICVKHSGIIVSSLFGLAFYLFVAFIISTIPVNSFVAFLTSSISFFIFIKLFRKIEVVNIENKIRITKKNVVFRAILSCVIIVIITTLANLIGSSWSGVFSAFPSTLYPLLIIIHLNYGKKVVNSIIKFVPQGLGGLLIYSFGIHFTYQYMGINQGMFLSLLGSAIYLFIYTFLGMIFWGRITQ